MRQPWDVVAEEATKEHVKLKTGPGNAKAWQSLGNAYYGAGNKAYAIQAWEKAVSLNPSNTQLAAYVAKLKGASTEMAPDTVAEGPESYPGMNPWAMGATVAALGAIMLFVF